MTSQRMQTLFIITFWVASMSWLGWAKLRPSAQPDRTPRQGDLLPIEATRVAPIRWRISLNGAPLGWARQEIERNEDGQGNVTSTVHLEQLSIDDVLQRGLGNLAVFAARRLGGYPSEITLTIDNTMQFDHFGELVRFRSTVREQGWGECIRMHGTVYDDQLVVRVYLTLGDTQGAQDPIKEIRLPMPPEKVLVDALSPRPIFKRLRVGQSWTFETYNPLFPTEPMQTVRARVIGKEVVQQENESVRTHHIVYERADDDGLSVEQRMGDVWVRSDGAVIRQSMGWGSIRLTFDRMSDASEDSRKGAGRHQLAPTDYSMQNPGNSVTTRSRG